MPNKARPPARKVDAGLGKLGQLPKRRTRANSNQEKQPATTEAAMILSRVQVDFGHVLDSVLPKPKQSLRASIRRPEDLLVLNVVFENLTLSQGAPPKLERTDAPPRIII